MDIIDFKANLNDWGSRGIPFIFIIDFEMRMPRAWKLDEVDASEVWYDFNGITNQPVREHGALAVTIASHPEGLKRYAKRFDIVRERLSRGDSFLTNLTIATPIVLSHSIQDIFHSAKARYKFMLRDRFIVFSPEIFVQVQNGVIRTFPMKGTIAADIPNAAEIILADVKETSEHVTAVDLLRNDLGIVATEVKVKRFRYIDEVRSNKRTLLQVSSELEGKVREPFLNRFGDLLLAMLPAGSVSGAPKIETVRIIREAEEIDRGYYTGVCGYFDGENLDSGVMIRFIEQQASGHVFRSGGGITTQSTAEQEYQEALDKIYVPVY
jgi:para-aminobenzoate synthetase component 1